MSIRKSAWAHLNSNPPALIRLLARRIVKGKTVRVLTLQEIAIASGLPMRRISEISGSTDWEKITIAEAERFIRGCNFDPLNPKDRNRKSAYERSCKNRPQKSKFRYLKVSPLWDTELNPLIQKLKSQKLS